MMADRRITLQRFRSEVCLRTPEADLALLLARVSLGTLSQADLRAAFERPIDWIAVRDFAAVHAVTPLVFDALKHARADIPSEVFQSFQADFIANVARNLALTAELLRVLTLFESHGIQAIPFKGPVLASVAYGNPCFRVFDDLDILVQQSAVTHARELLCENGYSLASHFAGAQEKFRLHWNDQITLVRDGGFAQIDLHWNFAPRHSPFALQVEDTRLVCVSMLGLRVHTIASEDLLIYLCAHGSKHLWQRLAWVCDIAALVRSQSLDWDAAIARAAGAERMLGLGLLLASDLLGLRLPRNIAVLIRQDESAVNLTERSKVRMFQVPAATPADTGDLLRMSLKSTGRLACGLRYLLGLVMLPAEADWSMVCLPSTLFFLYYPLRLLRLAWKHGGIVLRAALQPLQMHR